MSNDCDLHGIGVTAAATNHSAGVNVSSSPGYTAPEYLDHLRNHGQAGKRSMPLLEFALGLEAWSVSSAGASPPASTNAPASSPFECETGRFPAMI